MSRILLLLLLVFPPAAWAQRLRPTPPPAADTVYFDQDWEKTAIPADRAFVRLIRHAPAGNPTGLVRDYYYPSWKKQWEGKLLREEPDVPTGICSFWYESGTLKARGTYAQGQPGSDYQEYRPNGTPVTCKLRPVEALPTETAELHSYLHSGGSQHVFYVTLPEHTASAIYRLDIRDLGQPLVGWNTMLTLAKLTVLSGPGVLNTCVSLMQREASQLVGATKPTQCHYFVTTNREQALSFLTTHGQLPEDGYLFATTNTMNEVRPLPNLAGAHQLFICVNNDNIQAAAVARVSVTALVKQCQ